MSLIRIAAKISIKESLIVTNLLAAACTAKKKEIELECFGSLMKPLSKKVDVIKES